MKNIFNALAKAADWLDAEDDPQHPAFDPVHLGGVLILNLIVVGALYWVLWSALVYEGGIFVKLSALLRPAFGGTRGADDFDGWIGNVAGLALSAAVVAVLHSLYAQAARKAAKR